MSTSPIHTRSAMRNPVGRLTADHPGLVKLGRAGWLTKGIVYVIAGVLALGVAAKASGWADATSATGNQEASPTGAIKTVAGSSGGTLLLWLLAVGLLLYAAWRLVVRLPARRLGREGDRPPHRLRRQRHHLRHVRVQRDRAGPSRDQGSERQQQGHRHLGLGHGAHRRSLGDRRGGRDHRRGRPLPRLQGHHDGRQRRARPLRHVGDPTGVDRAARRHRRDRAWRGHRPRGLLHGARGHRLQRRGGDRSRWGAPAAGHGHLGSWSSWWWSASGSRRTGSSASPRSRGVASRHPDDA